MTIARTEQTVVADLDKPFREHVPEEAADEFLGRYRAALDLVGGRFFVRKSNSAVEQLFEALVGDGDAKDVGGKIFKSLLA